MGSNLNQAASVKWRRRKSGARAMVALLALLPVTLLVSLVTAPLATAAPQPVSAFTLSGTIGAGTFLGTINAKGSLAVESGTGNVAAGGYEGIEVFSGGAGPSDPRLASFGPLETESLAAAPSSNAFYVVANFSLRRYISDGAPTPTYTEDTSFTPSVGAETIAVDPRNGDIIAVSGGQLNRLSPSGAVLESFELPGAVFPEAVAVRADGSIYFLAEASGTKLFKFEPDGHLLGKLPFDGSPKGLAVDPVTGALIVVTEVSFGEYQIDGFNDSDQLIFKVPVPSFPEFHEMDGAVVAPNGNLYLYLGAAVSSGVVLRFDPAVYPGLESPVVSGITTTSARVSSEVDPGAGPPAGSSAHFEYSADEGSTWQSTPAQDDTAGPTIEAELVGLHPNVDYLVRAVATNDLTTHTTEPTVFTTAAIPPVTVTGLATDVSETSAVINATINPTGLQSTYRFEYGLTTSYGNRIPVVGEANSGNGRAPRIFSRTLNGLQPGTTYHYRIVARNVIGETVGEDRTFTTISAGGLPARSYEQVTPPQKLGGTIEQKIDFAASPDGNAFSYGVNTPGTGLSSPQFARFFSLRESTDWRSGIGTDPPMNTARSTVFQLTLGISSDYRHAFVVSNRALTPGAIENGANFYIFDVETGTYTLVVATEAFGTFRQFTTVHSVGRFLWGNSGFTEVIFESPTSLMTGAPDGSIYRWSSEAGLTIESLLPGGNTPASDLSGDSVFGERQFVSEDGKRVYFASSAPGQQGVYLREGGQTRPVSVVQLPGEPELTAAAQFLGTSGNGRYAFFFSENTKLTNSAPGVTGDIYRYDADTGELEYLGAQAGPGTTPLPEAMLAIADDGSSFYFQGVQASSEAGGVFAWHEGGTAHLISEAGPQIGHAFGSPDGRYLAFANNNEGNTVFVYDADTEQVACASCLSDGSNPGGAELPEGEKSLGSTVPRAVNDKGQVFFTTSARLVAADVNGVQDAYEFHEGKARLISPGDQPFAATYADSSTNGDDVFFTTAQKLVGRDEDKSFDVYDARIGGGLPAQSPPPAQTCIRDDCKATPNAGPELPFGGSEALAGPGNVAHEASKKASCQKAKGKAKASCAKHHKRKKKSKSKHAKRDRRQGR